MNEKPILLKTELVRAILDGRKTQTRRPLSEAAIKRMAKKELRDSPFGVAGDKLWVRETWRIVHWGPRGKYRGYHIQYKDGTILEEPGNSRFYDPIKYENYVTECIVDMGNWWSDRPGDLPPTRWRPSIHMPRWASRITLDVVEVVVEPLQNITPLECAVEGVDLEPYPGSFLPDLMVRRFIHLWNSIYTKPGQQWADNPLVWCCSFSGGTRA